MFACNFFRIICKLEKNHEIDIHENRIENNHISHVGVYMSKRNLQMLLANNFK